MNAGGSDSGGKLDGPEKQQYSVDSSWPSRRRTVLKSLWYSLGAASAVALVAVVGTQIVQGGGYDQKMRELEHSHSQSIARSQAEESSKIAAATKYAHAADICEVVGDEPYAAFFDGRPDEVEPSHKDNSEFSAYLMMCNMKAEHPDTYEVDEVTISAWQYNDIERPQRDYEAANEEMTKPQKCADSEWTNCTWVRMDHQAMLVAHDYNLYVQILVAPSSSTYASVKEQELAGVLTEYAQLMFDGLRID